MTQSTFLPSLTDIQNLTDLDHIEALLNDTQAREAALDEELQAALVDSEKTEGRLEHIEELPLSLKPIFKHAKTLSTTVTNACSLAERVSKKVKDLDALRERLRETTRKVQDIIDVKNCIEGVQRAMDLENYAEAASYIQRYLHIDESVLDGTAAAQLRSAERKLKEIVHKKLEEAMRGNDEQLIIKFCALCTPLGLREEGLTQYSHYLRNVCSQQAEGIYKHLQRSLGHSYQPQQDGEETLTAVDAITKIVEGVAGIIEDRSPLVEQHFGAGSTLVLLKNLQAQSDVHTTKTLDLFVEHFAINKTVEEVNPNKKRNQAVSKDPRELGPILEELALVSQSAELYDRFLRQKAKAAQDAIAADASGEAKQPAPGLMHVSEFNRRIQELLGHYITLEEYFMVESARKAMKADRVEDDSLTSSSVDHLFFVLQKCAQRALLTSSMNAVCAVINIVISVLGREFKEVLQKSFQDQLTRGGVTSIISRTVVGPQATDKYGHTVILNNLDVASDYILKLKKEVESECLQLFQTPTGLDPRVKSCIDDLVETSNGFKKLLQADLEQASSLSMPKLKVLLTPFAQVGYEISEVEFAEYELTDPFIQQFIAGFDGLISPLKTQLTPSNYDNYVHLIVRAVVHSLEQDIFKKKFNQLGGLQFDKELRRLQHYLSSVTQKTVRDKFSRLSQMATLLCFEQVGEVLDHWGQNSGSMTWRLTPNEVRKILGLREDFDKTAISKLKL
eukprot:TRINITY_DN1145_c1_g1_i1.p1 TRINITY_DN1145_c1_g1~~TRINITY_DN1145_c1_g1_i1.p1  ORF type:complete len:733 (-),score=336.79 TRINITY_DN1145_c1_g1_i1:79-2277(-)